MTLNNGLKMPAFGLGVFVAHGNAASKSVEITVGSGYLIIVTASVYGNAEEFTKGILASGVSRNDCSSSNKFLISDYSFDSAFKDFEVSLFVCL